MASGGPLGDTDEEVAPEVVRPVLKALAVAASLLGIAFALAETSRLDEPHGAPVTPQASITVTVAVPAPTTTATQVPARSPAAVDNPTEPSPTAAKMRCPPTRHGLQVEAAQPL